GAGGVSAASGRAAGPVLYEGSGPWDVGFLLPAGDRLAYVGEQARFVLTREHVRKLRLAPGVPSWLRTRRVALTWHDPATGAGGTVAVWPCDSGTVLRQRRATRPPAPRTEEHTAQLPSPPTPPCPPPPSTKTNPTTPTPHLSPHY